MTRRNLFKSLATLIAGAPLLAWLPWRKQKKRYYLIMFGDCREIDREFFEHCKSAIWQHARDFPSWLYCGAIDCSFTDNATSTSEAIVFTRRRTDGPWASETKIVNGQLHSTNDYLVASHMRRYTARKFYRL